MLRSLTRDEIIVEAKDGLVDKGTRPPWENLWRDDGDFCLMSRSKLKPE